MVHIYHFSKYVVMVHLPTRKSHLFFFLILSCRCCDPSERPGHLWLLLELCHNWNHRGRSLPKGERAKKSLSISSPCFCFCPAQGKAKKHSFSCVAEKLNPNIRWFIMGSVGTRFFHSMSHTLLLQGNVGKHLGEGWFLFKYIATYAYCIVLIRC